ncbi:MAG TPA: sulfotransferase [Devosia sp.]|nr:sulfotransferase [Devosia sp.]
MAREPGNISALACRAMARWDLVGQNTQSLDELARAVSAAPDVSALRHNYGTLLTRAGRVDEAAEQYRAALSLRPDDAQAFWGLTLNSRIDKSDALLPAMEALYASPGLDSLRQQFLAYGLAKAFDDLNVPDRAIRYAIEANRLCGGMWDAAAARERYLELSALAAEDAFRAGRTSGHPTRLPLFIVGMPRSGTTLIETILSRHPGVVALGESRQIGDVVEEAERVHRSSGRMSASSRLKRDWLSSRAERIAGSWSAARRADVRLVTDKMPDNAFVLDYIRRLFPNARVVYARRHPLDTGVSNFFVRFGRGHAFSTRLDWIGTRSRLLADTMDLWKGALDLPILDVHYERLVADPEVEIRRLVAFAGLDWTDDFLTPEQSTRSVGTASQWQVRQPIYRTSVARWRRYEPWLGPMIEAMGGLDWVAAREREATG